MSNAKVKSARNQTPSPAVFEGALSEVDELRVSMRRHPKTTLRVLDGAECATKARLMAHFAAVLQFPSYFGRNWDALEECLHDLGEWIPGERYVLVVVNAHLLLAKNHRALKVFVDLIKGLAASENGHARVEFVFQFPSPHGRFSGRLLKLAGRLPRFEMQSRQAA